MSSNLLPTVKSISGHMELSFKLIKLIFSYLMISIMNTDQKNFKEIHTNSQFINQNVQLSNGEKISRLETQLTSLTLLEVGTIQLSSVFKRSKMVGKEFKLLSKFIMKMETKQMKMENISDLLIIKKNMMLFQLRLHHIVQSLKNFVTNPQNHYLT